MIGVLLNNRYEIASQIGQGGMGVVYRAKDTLLEREVAVKVLSSQTLDVTSRARMLREARAVAKLNHPNIVTIFDAGKENSIPFIVMEYVEGFSLYQKRLESPDDVIVAAHQICLALAHAHEKGIIHRDIKPENVLMTPDGSVKLMDFGLARSLASRLTIDGAFLGTVFYIAPEQAIGGQIDARADLYALGVMLYEFLTGVLPFQAEDPLAIVTQHLHAPVVPPRAKNPDISPALSELIVSLMAKKPENRPKSAAEVVKILELLQVSKRLEPSAPKIQSQVENREDISMLSRIIRGRIVGRDREISEARAIWRQTIQGEGRLLLISGEPGIGKSRLVREIVTQVEISGRKGLVGECYPEGGAPYGPFAQMIEKALLNGLGEIEFSNFILADLLVLAPALRAHYPDIPANPMLDPLSEKHRVFENAAAFFAALASAMPILLVFEDVHWADSGTLSLLRHVARRMRNHPILIVTTYREVELDRSRPFQNLLVEWYRERLAVRIKLSRLDRIATESMLEALFGEAITGEFLEAVFRETEGNPFFVEEVIKALVEDGNLVYENGEWTRPAMEKIHIPQSVRVAIQSRITRLPDPVQENLTLGAILGREFDFEALLEVSSAGEDDLVAVLEIAEKAQLIEEKSDAHGGTFRFVHALIPGTLVEGLSGLRLRRTHKKVAQVLEHVRPDDFARLAFHYVEGGDLENGLKFSIKAGEEAARLYANEDAVNHFGKTIELAEALNRPETVAQANLEISLLAQGRDNEKAFDAFEAALDATQNSGKRGAILSWYGAALITAGNSRGLVLLQEAEKILDPETQKSQLALVYSSIGRYHHLFGAHKKGLESMRQGIEIAEGLDDPDLLTALYSNIAGVYQHLTEYETSIQWARKLIEMGEKHNHPPAVALGYEFISEDLLYTGRLDETWEAADRNEKIGRDIGLHARVGWSGYVKSIYFYTLGDLTQGLDFAKSSLAIAEDVGDIRLVLIVKAAMIAFLVDMGQQGAAEELVQDIREKAGETGQLMLLLMSQQAVAYYYGMRGDWQAAYAELATQLQTLERSDNLQVRMHRGIAVATAALEIGHLEEAETVINDVLQISVNAKTRVLDAICYRILGQIHGKRAQWEAGDKQFEKAGQMMAKYGMKLELGRNHYYRGEMKAAAGDQSGAKIEWAAAGRLFGECGAMGWAELVNKR